MKIQIEIIKMQEEAACSERCRKELK